MRTHNWVNALIQTRESPLERLFRGITWLLGNSVALPRRPGYFRLPSYFHVTLLVCFSVRYCVQTEEFLANFPFSVHAHLTLLCYVTESYLQEKWCGWTLLNGDFNVSTLGVWAVPESWKSHFSWGNPSFHSAFLFFTQYVLQINYPSPHLISPPPRKTGMFICTLFTTSCSFSLPTSNQVFCNKSKTTLCCCITSSCTPS